jgi:hypothetical protein
MLTAVYGISATNLTPAVHCCSLPRRRVTKQFICHHVRLKWKSDLPVTGRGAIEQLLLPSRETAPRCLMSRVIHDTDLSRDTSFTLHSKQSEASCPRI